MAALKGLETVNQARAGSRVSPERGISVCGGGMLRSPTDAFDAIQETILLA
ncbi:hypothetical protein ACFFSY_30975 [Paenibacillus aurantiacus]|uniref:Uncharacterized protein n=1 Tax=Paenibacillus aurantiacus TaxID=1936118 RepID=A0ABV5KYU9_9BACL